MTCELKYSFDPHPGAMLSSMTWRRQSPRHICAKLPGHYGYVMVTKREVQGHDQVRAILHGGGGQTATLPLIHSAPEWQSIGPHYRWALIDGGVLSLDDAAWLYPEGIWFNAGYTYNPPPEEKTDHDE